MEFCYSDLNELRQPGLFVVGGSWKYSGNDYRESE